MRLKQKLQWLLLCCITCVAIAAGLLIYNWQLSKELQRYQQVFESEGAYLQSSDPLDVSLEPWSNLKQWSHQVDDYFEKFNGSLASSHQAVFAKQAPTIKIEQKVNAYQVLIHVPQGHNIDVEAQVVGNRLHLSGMTRIAPDQGASRFEARSQFSHVVALSEPVDGNQLSIEQKPEHILVFVPKLS